MSLLYFCFLSLLSQLALAFTFTTSGDVTQCGTLDINWTGGSGTGYFLTVVPIFGIPFNVSIPDSAYHAQNSSGFFSTQLPVNASDQRAALTMSDSTGFGKGGTSKLHTIGAAVNGATCDLTGPDLSFVYSLTQVVQCQKAKFTGYLESTAVAPVTVVGIVPGGTSFQLDVGSAKTFDWNVNIFNGTDVLLFMYDSKQRQGGSELFTVGLSGDTSCINNDSPSSTEASSPTSSSSPSPSSTSSDSKGTSVGAIAGSVLGAIIFLAVFVTLGLFCLRQWQDKKRARTAGGSEFRHTSRPLGSDLDLTADGDAYHQQSQHLFNSPVTAQSPFGSGPPAHYQHSQYLSSNSNLHANPFGGSAVSLHAASDSDSNPTVNPFTDQRTGPGSESMSGSRRKSQMSAYKPPSRFMMHTDAEDVDLPENEDGVVELPPSYVERTPKRQPGQPSNP
ncbi:Methionine vitamin-b12 [Mycena kentingensis (nom. inval.)]|nr:Methionine vitamin-b12 [Mycena kentingensis (nom. inval.)]